MNHRLKEVKNMRERERERERDGVPNSIFGD